MKLSFALISGFIRVEKAVLKTRVFNFFLSVISDFSANHGWTSEELNAVDVTKSEALKKYLTVAQADISSVEVPKVTDAELEDIGKMFHQ